MADYENQNYNYGNSQLYGNENNPSESLVDKQEEGLLGRSRLGFIRKVYMILGTQMLFTVLMTLAAMFIPSVAEFQQNNVWAMIVAIILVFVILLVLICKNRVARSVPANYICLGLFTLGMGYLVSATCSQVKTNTEGGSKLVLVAAVMTLGIVIALTIYAFTTKKDFTMMGGFLFCLSITLLIFGLIIAFSYSSTLYMVFCALGVLLYSIYLIYDTQLIVGKGKYQLELDDYVIGALMLYVDIIMIFLELLRLLRFVGN